jgi:hypothetical protein
MSEKYFSFREEPNAEESHIATHTCCCVGKFNSVPTLLPIKASLFTVLVLHDREGAPKIPMGIFCDIYSEARRGLSGWGGGDWRCDGVIKSDVSQRGSRGLDVPVPICLLGLYLI